MPVNFSSVQSSCSVVSDSLWPHGLQHARPPCPSPTSRAYLNSCPLSWWCHPAISSSVVPFSSHLQSFPESGSFQQVSPSYQVAKVLEFQLQNQSFQWILDIQDWFPLRWTGWISLLSKGLSRVFSNTTVQKHQFFGTQLSSQSNSRIHTYMTTGKTIALTRWTIVGGVISLLFNKLSRLVITFLPRRKHLWIS